MPEQKLDEAKTPPIPFPFRVAPTTHEGRRFKGAVLTAAGIDQLLREVAPLPRAMGEAEEVLARAIGTEVARRREARGWSQTELAAAIGCNRSAVSRWEAGRRLPSLPHLAAVGRVLGCGARVLLPTDELNLLSSHPTSGDHSAGGSTSTACTRLGVHLPEEN